MATERQERAAILKRAIQAYPHAISKHTLATETEYTPGSGAFNNYIGRLRKLGLVSYPRPGAVQAESILFLDKSE